MTSTVPDPPPVSMANDPHQTSSSLSPSPTPTTELAIKALDIEEAIEDIGKFESLQQTDSLEQLLLPELDMESPVLEEVLAEASAVDDWRAPTDINRVPKHKGPIELQLSKVVAVLLESKGFVATQEYIDEITELTAAYFGRTIVSLRNCTELQRRRNPSLADTETSFRLQRIHPWQLYDEILETRKLSPKIKSQIEVIGAKAKTLLKSEDPPLEANDESLPFFTNEHYEIADLVPKQSERPIYIPSFLPDLPPDYTYQNTPKYMDTITDLKALRLKLVEESRLTEKSLYDLIEDDEKQWRKGFEKELEEFSDSGESIMSKVDVSSPAEEVDVKLGEKEGQEDTSEKIDSKDNADEKILKDGEQIETALGPTVKEESKNRFDFIEYANKRKQILQKREDAINEKIRLRENNIFIQAEKYYSPYADLKVTPEVDVYFLGILHEEFKSVIKAVRRAEANKKRKVEQILQEKAKKDKLMEDELSRNEFGLNFNPIDDSLDEDNGEEIFPQFDFDGESEPTNGIRIENGDDQNPFGFPEETPFGSSRPPTSGMPNSVASKAPFKAPSKSPVPSFPDEESSDDDLEAELENAMASVEDGPVSTAPLENGNELELDSDEDELHFGNI